jgi:hypothetical protein
MDKVVQVAQHWYEQFASSLIFSLVGISIGLGQLLASNERITARLLLGRALSTGGLAMAAGIVLVWVPELSLVGQIGVAAGLASLGTSGLERAFQRAIDARR